MDPRSFRVEHARFTQQIADSKAVEQRLSDEVARGDAEAAKTGSFPPAHNETRWLLARAQEATQRLRNNLDRLMQRRTEAIVASILARLRQKFPKEVAQIEQQAGAEFALDDTDGAQ
jgi:hypothetical protein